MKSTLIYIALLLSFVMSANAEIIYQSILEPFPPQCKSVLMIRIQGFGEDILGTSARTKCEASCDDGVEDFKNQRCPQLCGLASSIFLSQIQPAEVCNLCSNGTDAEVNRCQSAVDSLVGRCKQGCQNNSINVQGGSQRVSSTSGRLRLPFPSQITN